MGMGRMVLVKPGRGRYFRGKKPALKYVPKAIKAVVKRAIQHSGEKKFSEPDIATTFASVSNVWTELDLCNPAQGDSSITRIGRVIDVHSIEMEFCMATGDTEIATDDPWNVVRMIIGVWDGDQPTPLTTIALTMNDNLKKDIHSEGYLKRKLYDKYHTFNVSSTEKGGGDGYTPQVKRITYNKVFKNPLRITWGDDTQSHPNQHIVLSMISDSAAVPNPGILEGHCLVRYSDV